MSNPNTIPTLLLSLSLILIYFTHLTAAQGSFLLSICNNDNGNFTNNSAYGTNLDTALSSITSNIITTIYGFNTTSVGINSDTSYALALCRGDIDPVSCGQCINISIFRVRERCPNQREAIIWYDFCMLRYSNRSSILTDMDTSLVVYMRNTANVTDVTQFNDDLRDLLSDLQTRTADGGPLQKYATGNVSGPDLMDIYGLMQCTPNLSNQQCARCLTEAIQNIPTCCDGRRGGRVIMPSCNLRYEAYSFLQESPSNATPPSSPPPPESLSPLPPPPPGENDNTARTGMMFCYALALCRGDIDQFMCGQCVYNLKIRLREVCPNQRDDTGWYELCMLRHSSNASLLTEMNDSIAIYLLNPGNVNDPTQFNVALNSMFSELQTQAGHRDTLRKFETGNVPSHLFLNIYGLMQCTPNLSGDECNSCLTGSIADIPNCCSGRRGGSIIKPSCNLRFETTPFFQATPVDATQPAAPPSLQSPSPLPLGENDNRMRTVVIIVVLIVVFVLLVATIWIFISKRKKRNANTSFDTIDVDDDISTLESLQYDLETIRTATDFFSHSNKLGQGGFGAVYKGRFQNGLEIAVKRLSENSAQGELEFKNEVVLLAKLQHRNLVRLLGFCLQRTERLLIYEFVPNVSLDHFIFDPVNRVGLDWDRRYKIIGGVARGLIYLHEDSRLRIIHRDLKASNILLDNELNPKIADFGMARLCKRDETQGNTNRIVGTYGYMAPEYAMHGKFSVKSDVFSFGVLVLEIISGQRNNFSRKGENIEDLLSYAWKNWQEQRVINTIDPILRSSTGTLPDIIKCIHIGLLCVQENIVDRPTMASVISMFISDTITLPIPSQPAFFMHVNKIVGTEKPSSGESANTSVNDVSLSAIYPR